MQKPESSRNIQAIVSGDRGYSVCVPLDTHLAAKSRKNPLALNCREASAKHKAALSAEYHRGNDDSERHPARPKRSALAVQPTNEHSDMKAILLRNAKK